MKYVGYCFWLLSLRITFFWLICVVENINSCFFLLLNYTMLCECKTFCLFSSWWAAELFFSFWLFEYVHLKASLCGQMFLSLLGRNLGVELLGHVSLCLDSSETAQLCFQSGYTISCFHCLDVNWYFTIVVSVCVSLTTTNHIFMLWEAICVFKSLVHLQNSPFIIVNGQMLSSLKNFIFRIQVILLHV